MLRLPMRHLRSFTMISTRQRPCFCQSLRTGIGIMRPIRTRTLWRRLIPAVRGGIVGVLPMETRRAVNALPSS